MTCTVQDPQGCGGHPNTDMTYHNVQMRPMFYQGCTMCFIKDVLCVSESILYILPVYINNDTLHLFKF